MSLTSVQENEFALSCSQQSSEISLCSYEDIIKLPDPQRETMFVLLQGTWKETQLLVFVDSLKSSNIRRGHRCLYHPNVLV